jgi:hypothetical protein
MLMDQPIIDDDLIEVRRPTYRDNDAAMRDAIEAEMRTSPEQHEEHEVNAMAYLKGELAGKVLDPSSGLLTIEDEALGKKIDDLHAAQEAAKEAGKAASDAATKATAQVNEDANNDAAGTPASGASENSAGNGAGNANDQKTPKAEKPTELESALSSIRQNGERQQRIVILGDPDLQQRFMDELIARKKLHYVNGAPVTTLSHANAVRLLTELAREKAPETQFRHALSLSMQREDTGLFGGTKPHQVEVFVAGNQAVVDKEMKDISSFVTALEKNGHVEKGASDGLHEKLLNENRETVKLIGTSTLRQALSDVKDTGNAFKRQETAKQDALKEHRDEKNLKEMAEAKAKLAPESGKNTPELPHERTAELVAQMDRAFQAGGKMLGEQTDGKQSNAMASLHQARGFTDPVGRELQTLPDSDRQKAIVQLAAIVSKASAGEFGESAIHELDKTTDKKPVSPRDKVDAYIVMEAKRDPDFAAKAEPLLKELVGANILSEQQAEAITNRVSEVTAAVKAEVEKEKAATDAAGEKTAAAASDATKESVQATATEASQQKSGDAAASGTATSAESASKSSSTTDTASAESAPAKTGESVAATADAASKPEGTSTEAAGVSTVEATARDHADSRTAANTDASVEQKTASATQADSKTQGADNSSALAAHASSGAQADSSTVTAKTGESGATTADTASKGGSKSTEAASVTAVEATAPDHSDSRTTAHTDALAEQKAENATQADSKAQGADKPSAPAARASSGAQADSSTQAGVTQATSVEPNAASAAPADIAASSTASATRETTAEVKSVETEKPQTLRERIATLAREGSHRMTAEQAHSLVAELDGIRSKPLSALDAGSRNKPSQTLANVETLLKRMESGKLGHELQAQAKDLAEPFQKWVRQDDARREASGLNARTDAVAPPTQAVPSGLQAAQEVVPPRPPEVVLQPAQQNSATQLDSAARTATPEQGHALTQAPTQPSAEQVARSQADVRFAESEAAGAKLSQMMANPPGSFTNRDKSWNEDAIQKAAREVLRLDPEAVAQMSPNQRGALAGYSAWLADKADSGRLPSFTSHEGKEMASQLAERATTLLKQVEGGLPPAVAKILGKADAMVSAREQLDAQASHSSSASISKSAASGIATDMVTAVYRQDEVKDAQVKFMLRNATNLTPESVQSLDPQSRAKTAVALEHIAQSVRDGSMGPFSQLPSSVQKSVVSAQQTADKLLATMNRDPAMREELNQAYNELHAKSSGTSQNANAAEAKSASKSGGNEASVSRSDSIQDTGKSGGRGHDR